MPCESGCTDHNMDSDRAPTGNDDPCNNSGEGTFCPGAFWLHVDGSDCGDVLYMRTGDTCGAMQWIQVPLPGTLINVVPPVNGVDICPNGSTWTIPAGTNGSLIDAVWLSLGNGQWCQICGNEPVEIRMAFATNDPADVVLAGVNTLMYWDELVSDPYNEVVLNDQATTWTPTRTGWYQICGGLFIERPTATLMGNIMLFNYTRNGILDTTRDITQLVEPGYPAAGVQAGAVQISGCHAAFFTAGEVIQFQMIQLAWPNDTYMRGPDTWVQMTYLG